METLEESEIWAITIPLDAIEEIGFLKEKLSPGQERLAPLKREAGEEDERYDPYGDEDDGKSQKKSLTFFPLTPFSFLTQN